MNWWPLEDAITCRYEQTRSEVATADDLNGALKNGRLRSSILDRVTGRKVLSASAWAKDFYIAPSLMSVHWRGNDFPVVDRWFFVWKKDFEKIFGTAVLTPAAPGQVPEKQEETRGRKPQHEWPKAVEEILLRMRKSPKKIDADIAKEVQLEWQTRGKKALPTSTLHEYIAAVRRGLKPR
jgi:hypothetical protein